MKSLEAKFSTRTRQLGTTLLGVLKSKGASEKDAISRATKIAEAFGKVDKKRAPDHSEMVVYGHEEWEAALELASTIGDANRDPTEAEIKALPRQTISLDCALFGRMRAANPNLNRDAAVAVSHPLSVNQAAIEADFWTSVDDLNAASDSADQGSGGMGDVEFGSAIYYTYAEISVPALEANLSLDAGSAGVAAKVLARQAIQGLIQAIATAAPSGHRSTFGNAVRAGFLRVECGQTSGNLYCPAFETPVVGMSLAVEALRAAAAREERAYDLKRQVAELSVAEGKGSLAEVLDAVRNAVGANL
jgi:CRISPR system Cascade subunit CasC